MSRRSKKLTKNKLADLSANQTKQPSKSDKDFWHSAMLDVTRHDNNRILPPSPPKKIDHAAEAWIGPAKTRPEPVDLSFHENDKHTESGFHRHNHAAPPLLNTARDTIAGLDRSTAARFRKGLFPIEGRLDLHGRTQERAIGILSRFIKEKAASGQRCILIITGKGLSGSPGVTANGVLRTQLPEWLSRPSLRGHILAIAPALPRDGGGGAFYVLLRRIR